MNTYTKIKNFITDSALYFIMLIAVVLMGEGGGQ